MASKLQHSANSISLDKLNNLNRKQVLSHVQDNPQLTDFNQIMINLGLSKGTIEHHLNELKIEIRNDVFALTDEGLEQLKQTAQIMHELDRYELIVNYYRMMPLSEYLALMRLSLEEFELILELLIAKGRVLQKRSATQVQQYFLHTKAQDNKSPDMTFKIKINKQLKQQKHDRRTEISVNSFD